MLSNSRVLAPFIDRSSSEEERTTWRELVRTVAVMEVCLTAHTILTKETFIPKEPIRKVLVKLHRVKPFFDYAHAIIVSNPYKVVSEVQ